MDAADISVGPVVPAIDWRCNLDDSPVSPAAVNDFFKARRASIGHDPRHFL